MGRDEWPCAHKSVASHFIQEHAVKSWTGRNCMGAQKWKQKDKDDCFNVGCRCCCGWVAMYLFVGVIVMIGCLAGLIVEPHYRSQRYLSATCNISQFETRQKGCSCGKHCSAENFCVNMKVEYEKGSQLVINTLLPNEAKHECTWESSCNWNTDQKKQETTDYISSANQTTTFSCLYDPHSDVVIKNRRYDTDTEAIVSITIPIVCFVLSLAWLVIIFATCGCRYFWDCQPPSDVRKIVENMQRSGLHNPLQKYEYEERKRIIEQCSQGPMQNPAVSTVQPQAPTLAGPPPSYDQSTKPGYPVGFSQPGDGFGTQKTVYDNPGFSYGNNPPPPAYSGTGGF